MVVNSTAEALDGFGEALGAIGRVKILNAAEQVEDKKVGKRDMKQFIPAVSFLL